MLDKFNSFDKNLKFTFDDFPDSHVHFLDLKITKNGIDIFRKNTHTGQYTNFSSFEPFSRKVSWINSLFFRASKICSNATLFNNQINKIKRFMSWNDFPTKVRNFLIKKLKANLCNDSNITLHGSNDNDDSVPKIWLKLPYLGRQGEFLVKNLIRKVRRSLKIHVKIIVVYQTKKTPFFLPNKDKIPDSNKANVVYEFSCPGCGHSYIGKTERSLETRLSEHANINSYKTSAITQHLLNCPDGLYLANLNTFPDLDSSEEFSDKMHCPTSLVYTNSKILYSCKYNNPNQLLILEALLIKRKLPELNCGLKASKQLSLFL